jgi:hypothetical protein
MEVPVVIDAQHEGCARCPKRSWNAARRANRFKSIDDTIVQWIHLHACRISVSHPIESGMRKGQFF